MLREQIMGSNRILTLILVFQFVNRGLSLLPKPQNITITSTNLESVLQWSPVTLSNGTVNYTVQYNVINFIFSKMNSSYGWMDIEGCAPTNKTHCNFTSAIKVYQTATLQVRAQNGNDTSAWQVSDTFRADEQTHIGPPEFTVHSESHMLRVIVFNLPEKVMQYYRDRLQYKVYYWEDYNELSVKYMSHQKSPIEIKNLQPLKKYCLKVQIQIEELQVRKESKVQCAIVLEDEDTRGMKILLISIFTPIGIIAFIICGIFFVKKSYGQIKRILHPPLEFPEHIQQFLSDSTSNISAVLQGRPYSEESCDTISFLFEAPTP